MHRRLSLRTRFALSMALAFGGLCLFLVLFINLGLALFPGLRLPWASVVGLAVAVSGGGVSAYWLARVALRPVRSMQGAIQGVQPSTLHTRLQMTGPRDELRVLAESFDALPHELRNEIIMPSFSVQRLAFFPWLPTPQAVPIAGRYHPSAQENRASPPLATI